MHIHSLWLVVSVVAAISGPPIGRQDAPAVEPLSLAARRFFQPGDGATMVEVLAELRLAAVAPTTGSTARYRFEVSVADSAGTILTSGEWNREVLAAVARRSGASGTESFRFAATPGRYRVRMRVSAEGVQPVERELTVEAFRGRPPASDLVLATGVRMAEAESMAPGEIRRAGMALRSAPEPRLSLDSARLAYYLEVYPWRADSVAGELRAEVLAATGRRRIIQTPPRQVRIDGAGGLARGSLDLTGLPEGRYVLRVVMQLAESTVAAEAPFAVAGRSVVPVATAPTDPFEAMSESELDSLYGPTEYLLEDRERGTYSTLSLAGKRRFMQAVWRRRDPTPDTPDNPALGVFLRTLAYVNTAFREAGAGGVAGWLTDRGRVYLRNGAPEERLSRPSASPRPYEVWKFTRGRQRYYVFFDRSGLGTYELIGSNDVRESAQAGWENYLGPDGSRDVLEFIR